MFFACGSIIVNELTEGTLGLLGIGVVCGIIVTVLIYAVGHISGAHFNPAVTLAFWLQKKIPGKQAALYVVAQMTGATLAAYLLAMVFENPYNLGATSPSGSVGQTFWVEVLMTAFLMLVIFGLEGKEHISNLAAVIVGSTITLEVLFAGPISGASMNPARSFGPAFVSGHLEHMFIYTAAPLLGAAISVALCWIVEKH